MTDIVVSTGPAVSLQELLDGKGWNGRDALRAAMTKLGVSSRLRDNVGGGLRSLIQDAFETLL